MKPFYRPYMIIILCLWICGIHLTLKELYSTLHQKKALEDRIEYLQNELKRVQDQLALKIECCKPRLSKKFISEQKSLRLNSI